MSPNQKIDKIAIVELQALLLTALNLMEHVLQITTTNDHASTIPEHTIAELED